MDWPELGSGRLGRMRRPGFPLSGCCVISWQPHFGRLSRHRGILAAEGQPFLDKFDAHAPAGQLADQAAQVFDITGEAVHGVPDHAVAVTHERQQCLQLWAAVSLPEEVSVNTRSTSPLSSCRPGFCPIELTRM